MKTLLGGLSPAQFLRDYWHKRPLLIRNAVPGFSGLLSPDAMRQLAARDDVESRLIQGNGTHWQLDHGPFEKRDFKRLPKTGWTLLVQGVNLFLPEGAALLDRWPLPEGSFFRPSVWEQGNYSAGQAQWLMYVATNPDFCQDLMARAAAIQKQVYLEGLRHIGKCSCKTPT